MSVTSSLTNGGGGSFPTSVGDAFPRPRPPPPSSTNAIPFQFTFPPPNSTTVTSVLTILPTVVTTTVVTSSTSSNFISTVTETSISITPLPNPAATSALAMQSNLLSSNANLTRTNIIVSLVLGTIAVVLLLAILIILFIYLRRRRRGNDDESPPFTSLAPRPAPVFGVATQSAPQLPPEDLRETSLSMGPRRGTLDSYSRALATSQGRADVLAAIPLPSSPLSPTSPTRPSRSFSAPVSAPEQAPRIPPFEGLGLGLPSVNIQPSTPSVYPLDRDSTPSPISGGGTPVPAQGRGQQQQGPGPPIQRRPVLQPGASRMPMYHEALQDEAMIERQRASAQQAGLLGLPVIGMVGRAQRASMDSVGSEFGFPGGDNHGVGGNNDDRGGYGREREGRQGVLHSTRASSGVFPEGGGSPERERERRGSVAPVPVPETQGTGSAAGGSVEEGSGNGNESGPGPPPIPGRES